MHSAGTYLPNNGWKCANTKKYCRNTLRSLPSLVDAKAENITHDLFRFHIIFFDGIHFKVWIKTLNLHDLPNDVLHQVPICQTHANLALLRQAIPKKNRILWKQFIKCWLAWYGFCEVLFLFWSVFSILKTFWRKNKGYVKSGRPACPGCEFFSLTKFCIS